MPVWWPVDLKPATGPTNKYPLKAARKEAGFPSHPRATR